MNECPICKHESSDEEDKSNIMKLLNENKRCSEYVNPGGREFSFENGKRIQISDYCYHCDLKTIKAEIGSWNNK